jgi:hypothetical protein
MENAATERAKWVLNWPSQGGKWTQNAKKILLRGNKPKNLLKVKELAFSGAQNEVPFECPKTQSNPRLWPKIYNLWGIE